MSMFKNKGKFALIGASRHSFNGLKTIWGERAFKTELFLASIAAPTSFLLDISLTTRLILLLLLLLTLVTELLNSAIEAAIDRVSLDFHPLSKNAKDMGSAAVFMTGIMNVTAWAFAIYESLSSQSL